jgi:hypothetical protein
MNPDHRETGPVSDVHLAEEGKRALAVAARERPELEQDDVSVQPGDGERLAAGRVQPRLHAEQLGRRAEIRQPGPACAPGRAHDPFTADAHHDDAIDSSGWGRSRLMWLCGNATSVRSCSILSIL